MNKRRWVFSAIGVLALLVLVLLPGIMSVQILAHEFYHVLNHREAAKSFCVDVNNPPYLAHVEVMFPNETSMRTYMELDSDGEERLAWRFGHFVSCVYIFFSLLAIFGIIWLVTVTVKPERLHRRIVHHVRRLKRKLRRK